MDLGTPLDSVPGLGLPDRQSKALSTAGIDTIGDLLCRFPKRHEDRLSVAPPPAIPGTRPILLTGKVLSSTSGFGRGSIAKVEVVLDPSTDTPWEFVTARWFGMGFIAKAFSAGARVFLFGTPKILKEQLVFDHPEHEVIRDGCENLQLGSLVPIHASPRGITTRDYRSLVHRVASQLDNCPDLLPPPKTDGPFAGSNRLESFQKLHFPSSDADLRNARRYLALEWLVGMQLGVLQRRASYAEVEKTRPRELGDDLLQQLLAGLPFQPTGDQLKAIQEIASDLRTAQPMNRLLHGDVGSGKTLVAGGAIALAVDRGDQAAIMAPTQILAEQHFATFQAWFGPLGVRVRLLTSDRKEDGYTSGAVPQLVVGTHALLYSDDETLKPELVIIDEQHKFGVAQREALIARHGHPDVLVLTATPIPRTMVLTAYGDLEVSTLREKPAGRSPITTAARYSHKVSDLTKFLKREITKGRQCYLLFPLIDGGAKAAASDKKKPPSLEDEFPKWVHRLRPHAVDMVHGGMAGPERDAAMEKFRSGETAALLCTTVIEVGVDVSNASVMCIFGAGRFGLAQLHQLRGRVGRGSEKSFCLLLPDRDNAEVREKLAVLEETGDGFVIAEADLARRGPGEILGVAQSGHSAAAAFSAELMDIDFCLLSQKLAARIRKNDTQLQSPANQSLLELSSPKQSGSGALQ